MMMYLYFACLSISSDCYDWRRCFSFEMLLSSQCSEPAIKLGYLHFDRSQRQWKFKPPKKTMTTTTSSPIEKARKCNRTNDYDLQRRWNTLTCHRLTILSTFGYYQGTTSKQSPNQLSKPLGSNHTPSECELGWWTNWLCLSVCQSVSSDRLHQTFSSECSQSIAVHAVYQWDTFCPQPSAYNLLRLNVSNWRYV